MNIDDQGRLHLQIEPSDLPCDECSSPGPENRAWQLIGQSGVLCRSCLSGWIEEINKQLGTTAKAPVEGYKAQTGDVCIQKVRENQWNISQFMAGAWQYLFTISQAEVDTYISQLPLIGQTDGLLGTQRYYRPHNPVLYRPKHPPKRTRHRRTTNHLG